MTDKPLSFGGPWTDQKLAILRNYLAAYAIALSRTKFKKEYIDAFAGTGQREPSARAKSAKIQRAVYGLQSSLPNVPKDANGEPIQGFLDGSARIALRCDPPFDSYVFIERNEA